MKWFLTSKKITQYFYLLLLLTTIFFLDLYLFSILLQYYETQLLLIIMGLLCGIGALLTLNSIAARIKVMQKNAYTATVLYKRFSEVLVLSVGGTLMVLPGFVTCALGLVLYIKPVRLLCAHFFYKRHKDFLIKLFSLFLIDIISKHK